jgi:hypothetical protein
MKECKIFTVDYNSESQYNYQTEELQNAINAMLSKGWTLRKTHFTKYKVLLMFMRDVKLRLLE